MGTPNALQSSLIYLGGMSVQRLVNSCGTVTVAAYTAANKIDSMAIQPIVSLGMAVSVFTAQNMGANNIDRIKLGLKQTLKVMISSCIVIALGIVLFRTQLLELFLDKIKEGLCPIGNGNRQSRTADLEVREALLEVRCRHTVQFKEFAHGAAPALFIDIIRIVRRTVRLVPDFPIFDVIVEAVRPTLGIVTDDVFADLRPLLIVLRRKRAVFLWPVLDL